MQTAVDSSILFDVLTDDPKHRAPSLRALREASALGIVLACPVVWAEIAAHFRDVEQLRSTLAAAGINFDPFDEVCAELAGASWALYRKSGGTRTRLIADFLIGAHAQRRTGRLLTRDRGFFRRYFDKLEVVN